MELTDLTRDLEALRDEALAAIAAAADVAGARGDRARRPRQEGPAHGRPARDRRAAGGGSAAGRGGRERRPRRDRGRARGARRRTSAGRSSRHASGAEAVDVTTPGRPIRRGALHPIIETIREIADDLRPVRLRDLRGPRGRGRRHELPDAEHPARPPGARPLGHALRRHRGPPPADPHLARPDPGDAVRRRRRSGRCSPAAATATRRSTPATPRSSSRSRG